MSIIDFFCLLRVADIYHGQIIIAWKGNGAEAIAQSIVLFFVGFMYVYTNFVHKSLIDDEGINGRARCSSGRSLRRLWRRDLSLFFLFPLFFFSSAIFAECRGGARDDDKCDYEYAISARDFEWGKWKKKEQIIIPSFSQIPWRQLRRNTVNTVRRRCTLTKWNYYCALCRGREKNDYLCPANNAGKKSRLITTRGGKIYFPRADKPNGK